MDFPEPEAPIIATNSPRAIESETPLSAMTESLPSRNPGETGEFDNVIGGFGHITPGGPGGWLAEFVSDCAAGSIKMVAPGWMRSLIISTNFASRIPVCTGKRFRSAPSGSREKPGDYPVPFPPCLEMRRWTHT